MASVTLAPLSPAGKIVLESDHFAAMLIKVSLT